MKRLAAGAASLAGLLLLLVGAPWALTAWGRVGELAGIDWAHAFAVRDDGRLLLGVLSLVGWLAWLVLVVAVVVETVEVVDRLCAERSRRPHRLVSVPGLDLPRLLVRGLVVSVVTTILSLTLPRLQAPAAAQPVSVSTAAVAERVTVPELVALPEQVSVPAAVASKVTQKPLPTSTLHVVRPYDDLRGLAATYYGDASQWQAIADANSDLLHGQGVLRTGWRLVIPGVASPDGTTVVVVTRGDSLSRIAARYLGDGDRWPEIFALNGDIVEDADQIDIGWRLRLPGTAPAAVAAVPSSSTTAASSTTTVPVIPTVTPTATPNADEVRVHEEVPLAADAPVEPTARASESASVGPVQEADDAADSFTVSQALAMGVVGTLGAGMASALVRTIHRRRDVQLALRPVGRRIPYPSSDAMRVESALTLVGLPALPQQVRPPVVDEAVVATRVLARRGLVEKPWALVTAGFAEDGPVTLDLEAHRVTTVDLDDEQAAWGTAYAWALDLACTDSSGLDDPIGRGSTVVAVGPLGEALAAAALDSVIWIPSPDAALDDLVATVQRQREQLAARGWDLADARDDADARDAWWPRVYVFGSPDIASTQRLEQALFAGPATAVSAIVVRSDVDTLRMGRGARLYGSADLAVLDPHAVSLRPVSLSADGSAAVVALLATSGSEETSPAPWFAADNVADNVLPLHPRLAASTKEVVDVGDDTPGVTDFSHPTVLLLGPIQLVGAAGPPPARAERSCIECCAWMVEHPGSMASQMATALMVAETTRRSNVSRLRGWLGLTDAGEPYLPEAYTGRLYLDATVSSDWQRLQSLVSPGINRVPVSTLVSALKLVRGAPLADAAPGQWHWAEELRTDMASLIRDIGARVCEAALAEGDVDLARWATSRALTASPGDELLVRMRLRTEHRAGNRPEVERLVLQLTRHARMLGIDLDDETVLAIQEAIEGQPRARA